MKLKCDVCGRIGHWRDVCRSKKSLKAVKQLTEDDSDSEQYTIDSIDSSTKLKSSDSWMRTIRVDNAVNINFKIDTGADVTVIPLHLAKSFKLTESKSKLYGANNTKLNVLGQFEATLAYRKREIVQRLYVVENLQQPLLGRDHTRSENYSTDQLGGYEGRDDQRRLCVYRISQSLARIGHDSR